MNQNVQRRISEVTITPIKPTEGLMAFASVVLDDCLYLGSIGVHIKLDGVGYRITYPTKKVGGVGINIYHPITKEFGAAIERAICEKAEELFS